MAEFRCGECAVAAAVEITRAKRCMELCKNSRSGMNVYEFCGNWACSFGLRHTRREKQSTGLVRYDRYLSTLYLGGRGQEPGGASETEA